VARIAPGAIFTSAPVQMPVPASTPDNPRLRVDIADIYHHYGWDDELIMRGVGGSRQAAIVETPYSGRIDTVSPAVSTGDQEVVITGQAVSTADGTPVPDAALNLVITLDGFERNIAVTTDTDGAFSHTFTPLPTEAGIYTVAALYPDTLERPTQSTFTVSKIDIQPSRIRLNMPKNYQQSIPVKVTAAGTRSTPSVGAGGGSGH
jgi:hypothetical protein